MRETETCTVLKLEVCSPPPESDSAQMMESWDLDVCVPDDDDHDVQPANMVVDHDGAVGGIAGDGFPTCIFCGVVDGDVNPVATPEQKASKSEMATIKIFAGADILCRCVHLVHFSHMSQEVRCALDMLVFVII